MGSDPGNELQVVHPLHLLGVFPIPVADLGSLFIEGESLQGQQRADHVFSYPLGLFLSLGPDPAMNIEPPMPPGENPFCPFRALWAPASPAAPEGGMGRPPGLRADGDT